MALSLNGTSSYIESTSTPVTTFPFTMACWFNPANVTAGGTLMSLGVANGVDRFQMVNRGDLAGDRIAISSLVGATEGLATSTIGYTANTWHHATAVCTSITSRSIFLNGGGKATNTTSSNPAGINNIMLGSRWSTSRGFFFNGRIAEAAIWNAALTDDEVISLSKGFAPSLIRPSNLRFYNRCLRTSQDLSGGRTLTQVNITNFDHPRIYG
jgi:hypothetical protein